MSTKTLNNRLDRLHSNENKLGIGMAKRMAEARIRREAKQEQYWQLGLSQEEINAIKVAELRDQLGYEKDDAELAKRMRHARERLLARLKGGC